ncbi:glycoside hydrolase family 28 protein [Hyaloscypha variabilis F]|uniref:Glycoside hydrolase family 28 protein n=1 Tax=Hyaloscypha variabilis (strain UAMH 11265 / GT02V1 / F) TaxID=1149755 RepID=A0A2J6S3T8_HYAVF|nr:glycoside hydrolase family 28 protein [Hyaloscypha variabilis F]
MHFLASALLALSISSVPGSTLELRHPNPAPKNKVCTVKPNLNGSDDTPAILQAFDSCSKNGHIVFINETYHVDTVMNTTGLENVDIDLYGTLLWSTNITYWLNASLPFGYQNQSSAWWLGGSNIRFDGHGYGTLNGNGQVWYNFVNGESNYPHRPHALTIWNSRDSIFTGLRFVQSQMWTMTVFKSENIFMQDVYINSTSDSGSPARNTDGVDTIYSNNVHFDRMTIINGDDSISTKANSTNILITNSTFINGLGVALGSIGQYDGVYEILENITARDIICENTLHAGYVKTWTGERVGYPPNGGGGGLGYAKNTTFQNFTVSALRGPPFSISQCTTFSGVAGDCNSSEFLIEDILIEDIKGTIDADPIATYQCSAAAPCRNITMLDVELLTVNGTVATGWSCSNLVGAVGFTC